MSVSGVSVTVCCDGAFHTAEVLRFHDRAMKNDIRAELKRRGWVVRDSGETFCPFHPPVRKAR